MPFGCHYVARRPSRKSLAPRLSDHRRKYGSRPAGRLAAYGRELLAEILDKLDKLERAQ